MLIHGLSIIFSMISPTPRWHRREDKQSTCSNHWNPNMENIWGRKKISTQGVGNQRKRDEYCDLGSRPYCLKKLNCKARWSNAFCDFHWVSECVSDTYCYPVASPAVREQASKYVDRFGRLEGGWRSREWHGWDICLRPTQASGPLLHVADMLGGATCGVILAGHSSANLTIWDEICHQMNSRFLSRQHDCSSVSSSSPLDEITRREASIWKFGLFQVIFVAAVLFVRCQRQMLGRIWGIGRMIVC